jgi:hypothetical protein
VDRVTVDVHRTSTSVHATLAFRISTKRRSAQTVHVPIELSNGTAVMGMAYSLGGEPAIEAIAREANYALDTFTRVSQRRLDPALLRRVDHNFKRDLLDLAVFPVTRGMPASVTIELTLPTATRLVLDPGPHHKQQSFELPATAEASATNAGYVDGTTSLYAGDEPFREPNLDHRPRVTPTVASSDRRYELRKQIRAHATELGHCHTLGALLDPTLSSNLQLTIEIAARGTVERVNVGELDNDDVRRCVVDEISSWLFAESDHPRQVRQDIDLANAD